MRSSDYSRQLRERGAEILDRLTGSVMAELGVATGNLGHYLLTQRPDLTLYMIDSWLPEEDQPEAYRATGDSNAHHPRYRQDAREIEARNKVAEFDGARVMRMDTIEASEVVPDVDLVFIDADHSTEGCTRDIRAWWPKVMPGGWMGGHDYANPDPRFAFGVTEAVDRFIQRSGAKLELGRNCTWWVRKP